jgi:hypothetical protein
MPGESKEDEIKPQTLGVLGGKQKLQFVDKKIAVPAPQDATLFKKIFSKLLNKRFDLKMKVRGKYWDLA